MIHGAQNLRWWKGHSQNQAGKNTMKQKWIGRNWVVLVLGNLWNLGLFAHIGWLDFFILWKPNVFRKIQTTNPNHTFVRNKTCVFWKESSPDDTFHNELMSHYPSPSWCQVAVLKLMMEGCNLQNHKGCQEMELTQAFSVGWRSQYLSGRSFLVICFLLSYVWPVSNEPTAVAKQ